MIHKDIGRRIHLNYCVECIQNVALRTATGFHSKRHKKTSKTNPTTAKEDLRDQGDITTAIKLAHTKK